MRGAGARRLERRIVVQDRALKFLKPRAGLDPKLCDERFTRLPVALERLALPARTVESEHQLRTQTLA